MNNGVNGHSGLPPLGGHEATPAQRLALEAQMRREIAENPTNSAVNTLNAAMRDRLVEASIKVPLEGSYQ